MVGHKDNVRGPPRLFHDRRLGLHTSPNKRPVYAPMALPYFKLSFFFFHLILLSNCHRVTKLRPQRAPSRVPRHRRNIQPPNTGAYDSINECLLCRCSPTKSVHEEHTLWSLCYCNGIKDGG